MIFLDALMYILIGFIIGYLIAIPITKRNILTQIQKEVIDFFNSKTSQVKTMEIEIDINMSLSEIEQRLNSYNIPKEIVNQILEEIKKEKSKKESGKSSLFYIL